MRDTNEVLALWRSARASGDPVALSTIVRVQGSSYRVPGARLLVAGGKRAGSVSGGCLEDDLAKRSWWLGEKGPTMVSYDAGLDADSDEPGYGLGCNGTIHILVQRLLDGQSDVLAAMDRASVQRQPALIGQVIGPEPFVGQYVSTQAGSVHGNWTNEQSARAVLDAMNHMPGGSNAEVISVSSEALPERLEVFVERILPPVQLLIFGAGDDAIPLTEIAGALGWKAVVLDGRAHYARRDKFPHAADVFVRPQGAALPAEADEWTAAVIMSHSFRQDGDALRILQGKPLFYLGLLGPKQRTGRLLAETGLPHLATDSVFHAPMGLDLGGDGAASVALSVVAEIQAALNGRNGAPLSARLGSIHGFEEQAALDPNGQERAKTSPNPGSSAIACASM